MCLTFSKTLNKAIKLRNLILRLESLTLGVKIQKKEKAELSTLQDSGSTFQEEEEEEDIKERNIVQRQCEEKELASYHTPMKNKKCIIPESTSTEQQPQENDRSQTLSCDTASCDTSQLNECRESNKDNSSQSSELASSSVEPFHDEGSQDAWKKSQAVKKKRKTNRDATSPCTKKDEHNATELPNLDRSLSHSFNPKLLTNSIPPIVMDNKTHGQLVWWNRFLANRKRSQGTLIGNYLGRTIDLESEWFPGRNMALIRNHLKTAASSMGRRTLIIQSLGEMKYMIIPPRSLVAPFSSDGNQEQLLQGLKQYGSLNALRGLRRAEMIEEIRQTTGGRPNSMYEIEFLALCLEGSDGRFANQQCTVEELNYLKSVSVWDVLKTQDVKGDKARNHDMVKTETLATQKSSEKIDLHLNSLSPDHSTPPDCSSPTSQPMNTATNQEKIFIESSDSGHVNAIAKPQKKSFSQQPFNNETEILKECTTTASRFASYRRKGHSQSSLKSNEKSAKKVFPESSKNNQISRNETAQTGSTLSGSTPYCIRSGSTSNLCTQTIHTSVRNLIQHLCVGYSELVNLLGGVPFVLLCNQTGVNVPEEIPTYSFKVLEHIFSYSSNHSGNNSCLPRGRAIALHLYMANVFLHKLFRTIAVRVQIPLSDSPSTSSLTTQPNNAVQKNVHLSNISSKPVKNSIELFSTLASEKSNHSILFSLDHTHQSPLSMCIPQHHSNNKSRDPFSGETCCYTLKTPFPCALSPPSSWHNQTDPISQPLDHDEASSKQTQDVPNEKHSQNYASQVPYTHSYEEPVMNTKQFYSLCETSTLHFIGVGAETHFCDSSTQPSLSAQFYVFNLSKVSDSPPPDEEVNQVVNFAIQRCDSRITVSSLEKRFQTLQNLRDIAMRIKSTYEKQSIEQLKNDESSKQENWMYFESQWTDIYRRLK